MTATGVLVFARCAGFMWRAPGFSHPSVPPPLRAGLAFVLTLAVLPAVHASGMKLPLVLAVASDFAMGAAIGFAASILYDGAYAGGRALDDYVGIRGSIPGAQLFAPSGFGRVWSMVFTAGFFILGGYRLLIEAFARSFDALPAGGLAHTAGWYAFAIAIPAAIVQAALLVAAPAIALVFVVQVTLGALSRVIPRFASFTLSFPIVFGAALTATILAIPLLFDRSAAPWLQLPFSSVR